MISCSCLVCGTLIPDRRVAYQNVAGVFCSMACLDKWYETAWPKWKVGR